MVLIDTSVLIRSKQKDFPQFSIVTKKLLSLVERNELIIAPQNVYKFYVVATRPISANGFSLSPSEAIAEVNNLLDTYRLLPENEEIFELWRDLVQEFSTAGKTAHDTRLVAFMQYHTIKKIYTLNRKDFTRYSAVLELV